MKSLFLMFFYPISSGVCGSLASFFGKLAFQSEEIVQLPEYFMDFHLNYLIRAVLFLLMLNFNKMMFQFLFISWEKSGSFVTTCLNFVINNLLTALMGYFYFKEPLSMRWIIGSLLILSGVSIIASHKTERKS